jgi:hypothetical protein
MPYLAMTAAGDRVLPLDVEDDDAVYCPLCEGPLRIRQSHYNRGNFVSKHFTHLPGASCPGESSTHAKLKTIAAMKLREIFTSATIAHEKQIPGTDRIADVVATFDEPIFPMGNGIIVEIQHKHDEKEIGPISWNYLKAGYAVFWAYQSDFEGHEMQFAEHRIRTPWPDAIPITEGADGYPECVQQLLEPDSAPSVPMEVTLPTEYIRAHALEIIPPLRGHYKEGRSPEGWEKIDSVSLHGKGSVRAWINVLRSPSNHIFLEFWKKDGRNSPTYLPVHIGSEFPDRFEKFMESAREWFSEEDFEAESRHWIPGASLNFQGTAVCESWLSIAKVPAGPVKIIVGRRDRKGNTRTWAVNYRKGDLGRLAALRHSTRRLFGESSSRPNGGSSVGLEEAAPESA